jgi:hypothetical protein
MQLCYWLEIPKSTANVTSTNKSNLILYGMNIVHFFFFLSLVGGAALVPRIASKVLLGSLLDAGLICGECAVGGTIPGGRGSASSPRFITLSRLRSGLFGRERGPAEYGSSKPGGGGSGSVLTLSSCIAAFRSVSLAAHCCAFFQQ